MTNSVLQRFATSQKAKDLLNLFLTDKNITGRATALCGVCQMVGYKKATQEILQMLEGTHPLLSVPLQTLGRFWSKNLKDFSNKKLIIYGSPSISMVEADRILSKIDSRLYYIHSKVVLGDYK